MYKLLPRKPTHPLNNDGLEDDFPFENASNWKGGRWISPLHFRRGRARTCVRCTPFCVRPKAKALRDAQVSPSSLGRTRTASSAPLHPGFLGNFNLGYFMSRSFRYQTFRNSTWPEISDGKDVKNMCYALNLDHLLNLKFAKKATEIILPFFWWVMDSGRL